MHRFLAIVPVVFLAVACGGEGGGGIPSKTPAANQQASGQPSPLGITTSKLVAGNYVTTLFQPAVTFHVPDGWERGQEASVIFELERSNDPKHLIAFTDILPKQSVEAVVAQIRSRLANAGGTASKPSAVTIGNSSGFRLDGKLTHPSSTNPYGGALFSTILNGSGLPFGLEKGDEGEFFVVDVGGQTVAIAIAGPEKGFDSFDPEAEAVVKSVSFGPS
jgi:hypothetical protein